jgi:hypothetical protein
MRFQVAGPTAFAVGLGVLFVSACTPMVKKSAKSETPPVAREVATPTAVPTVPPPASSDFPTPRPNTVPTGLKPGESFGPEVTFFGITRADGKAIEPVNHDGGIPTYRNFVGSGFQVVVEGKPGKSGADVGRRVFAHSATDPKMRPDLEIEFDRPLGDGSEVICDRMRPKIGGIPALNPANFAETQKVSDTLNDAGCRFEVFLESESSCTLGKNEDWQFVDPQTKTQFCMTVAKAWNFPLGDTIVSVRLRDTAGNPGPVKKIRINRPKDAPTPRPRVQPTPTTKSLPTRD